MTTSSTAKFMAPGRKILSVLLVVLLIFCPLIQIRAYAASIEDIAMIIWAALRSCGINIVGGATSVVDFVIDELTDFASDAQTTLTDVVYGLKYSVNSLGQFIVNDVFVDTINDFIGFLTGKYNLQNNDQKQLNSTNTSLNGIVSYQLPITLINNANTYENDWFSVYASDVVYGIFTRTSNGNYIYITCWSEVPSTAGYQQYSISSSSIMASGSQNLIETADNGLYWTEINSMSMSYNGWDFSSYQIYDRADVHTALTELPDIEYGEEPIYAYTSTIIAPQYNTNYIVGDGAQINIGAPWGSSIYDLFDHIRTLIGSLSNQITIYYHDLASIESQAPKPSDVENLPAGTIYNINGIYQNSEGEGGIRFGGIWHYVTEWVEDFTEAAPIIWYVVTNSPDQIVNLLYATVVLTVVIGFIHKARSH